MHILPYHIPFFIQTQGCFKKFTGQGVEKNNDDAKRVFFHKSNKWDGARDILSTESRQWDLRQHEREKTTYTKRNHEYWQGEISEIRKQRRLVSMASVQVEEDETPDDNPVDYNKFTLPQLRGIIKEMGLKVKALSKLKKRELVELIEKS